MVEHAFSPRGSSDGISLANRIILEGEEEEDDFPLQDHPGKSCDDAHPGMSHDDFKDKQEEEEERVRRLSRDARESRSVLQDSVVPMPELRELMRSEEQLGTSTAAAATRTWQRAVQGIVEPAAAVNRAQERRRRRIARSMER